MTDNMDIVEVTDDMTHPVSINNNGVEYNNISRDEIPNPITTVD
jgi:hypothetical protein